MNDDEMDIFELARQCIKNNRAISSNRARLLSEWILKHEPAPVVEEDKPVSYDEPSTDPDDYADDEE